MLVEIKEDNEKANTITYKPHQGQTARNQPHIISISSGKGGVGKTLSIVNIASCAAKAGKKVLVLDGDLGLANVDVLLGMTPKYNLKDLIDGQVTIHDLILTHPLGIKMIPSGSGISQIVNLSYMERQLLLHELSNLNESFDYLLIDTGAGIGETVLHFNTWAHERVLITTPEPHAITDVYAFMKVAKEERGLESFSLVVNMASSDQEGMSVAKRITDAANRFLGIKVHFLGTVPVDPMLKNLIHRRHLAHEKTSQSISGQAWSQVAWKLFSRDSKEFSGYPSGSNIWSNLLKVKPIAKVET